MTAGRAEASHASVPVLFSCPICTPRPVVKRRSLYTHSVVCGRKEGHVYIELGLYHCSKVFEIPYFKTFRNSIIRGEQLSSPLQKIVALS